MQLLQLNKHHICNSTKALQLQLKKHYGCNSANASIATSRALQLQLWTCIFYNLYQTNCNSTSTLVATWQALQLQLFKNHFNCNSTRTPVGTPQSLQQLLDHFGCNSEHVIFIRWIATQQALQLQLHRTLQLQPKKASVATNCNSRSTSVASPQSTSVATPQTL
jgi:hypothetical protein